MAIMIHFQTIFMTAKWMYQRFSKTTNFDQEKEQVIQPKFHQLAVE
jgi:hypothetical protein